MHQNILLAETVLGLVVVVVVVVVVILVLEGLDEIVQSVNLLVGEGVNELVDVELLVGHVVLLFLFGVLFGVLFIRVREGSAGVDDGLILGVLVGSVGVLNGHIVDERPGVRTRKRERDLNDVSMRHAGS